MGKPANLSRDNFQGMFAGIDDEPQNPNLYHYALNMVPQPDGTMMQRPPFGVVATVTGGSVIFAAGKLRKRDGTVVNWRLTGAPSIEVAVLTGTGSWTTVADASDFTFASITYAATEGTPWATYSDATKDYIIFANGAQKPFAYDGATTHVACLTSISNAPTTARRPTSYAGKLFFIKSSDPRTIVWSEEFALNTGYQAGGYSNVWTLGQTSTEGLTSILGTNDALYFSRLHSIGKIVGQVGPDFSTSATQDAVSVGVGSVGELCLAGDSIWFLDPQGQPYYIPFGGIAAAVNLSAVHPEDPTLAVQGTGNARTIEPFGFGGFIWAPPTLFASYNATLISPFFLPQWRLLAGPTVWFPMVDEAATVAALVCDAETKRPICWVLGAMGLSGSNSPIGWTTYEFGLDHAVYPAIFNRGNSVDEVWILGVGSVGGANHAAITTGGDQNVSRVAQSTTYRFISGPISTPNSAMRTGDLSLELLGKGSVTGTAAMISSRRNDTSLVTTQSWTSVFSSSYRERKMITIGWEDECLWGRVYVSVASSTLAAFGIRRVGFEAQPAPMDDGI